MDQERKPLMHLGRMMKASQEYPQVQGIKALINYKLGNGSLRLVYGASTHDTWKDDVDCEPGKK